MAVTLPFINKKATTLPSFIKWFDNGGNDGLIGDQNYQNRNRDLGYDPEGYYAKLWWLGIRNPLSYFKHKVLGFQSRIIQNRQEFDLPLVPDHSVRDDLGGFHYKEVTLLDGSLRYEYYLIWPYKLLHKQFCFKLHIGWAIEGFHEQNQKEYYPFTCSITPFKSYRGSHMPTIEQRKNYWQKLKLFFTRPEKLIKTNAPQGPGGSSTSLIPKSLPLQSVGRVDKILGHLSSEQGGASIRIPALTAYHNNTANTSISSINHLLRDQGPDNGHAPSILRASQCAQENRWASFEEVWAGLEQGGVNTTLIIDHQVRNKKAPLRKTSDVTNLYPRKARL